MIIYEVEFMTPTGDLQWTRPMVGTYDDIHLYLLRMDIEAELARTAAGVIMFDLMFTQSTTFEASGLRVRARTPRP